MKKKKIRMERQDFVDNEIMALVKNLGSGLCGMDENGDYIDWDIDRIGKIRDAIQEWVVSSIISPVCGTTSYYTQENEIIQEFYPDVEGYTKGGTKWQNEATKSRARSL